MRASAFAPAAETALLAILAGNLAAQALRAVRDVGHTDFIAFLTGAAVLHDGGALYAAGTQAVAQGHLVGSPLAEAQLNHFVSPPPVALALEPLLRLPTQVSLALVEVVLVLCVASASAVLVTMLPAALPWRRRLTMVACAVGSFPAAWGIALGQWDAAVLAAVAGSLAILRSGRPCAAGAVLALGLVKPQLLWLVPAALATAGQWRMLGGLAAGAAVWAGTSLAIGGTTIIGSWAHATQGVSNTNLGRPPLLAVPLVLAGVPWLVRERRLLRADPLWTVAMGVALSLVCSPHVGPDDLMLLAPMLVLLARDHSLPAITGGLALSVAYAVSHVLPDWAGSWLLGLTVLCVVAVAASMPRGGRARRTSETVAASAA